MVSYILFSVITVEKFSRIFYACLLMRKYQNSKKPLLDVTDDGLSPIVSFDQRNHDQRYRFLLGFDIDNDNH